MRQIPYYCELAAAMGGRVRKGKKWQKQNWL
jgi:hypothetical protein